MSRTTAPLSDAACRLAKPTDRAYKLFDGDGLYLLVQPNGRKGWRLRYVKPDGREGLTSFGNYPVVGLADARNKREAKRARQIAANPASDLEGLIKAPRVVHRPALPLSRLPALQERIDTYRGRALTRLTVMLSLHVFVRSSELRFARWSEFDLKRGTWEIPDTRPALDGVPFSTRGTKMAGDIYLVPLSPQAVTLLEQIRTLTGEFDLVFAGDAKPWKPMSENTVNNALRTMGYDTKTEICGHGFRSMACSALIESGLWSETAIERQMSHKERNNVRAAYIHKAEFIEERRLIMNWWSRYLEANRQEHVTPHEFANQTGTNVTRLKAKSRLRE